jgi:hypothetical protein
VKTDKIPPELRYPSRQWFMSLCNAATGCRDEIGNCAQAGWCRKHRLRVHNGFPNGHPMGAGVHHDGARARRPRRGIGGVLRAVLGFFYSPKTGETMARLLELIARLEHSRRSGEP